MHVNENRWWEGDEMGVKSSDLIQVRSVCLMPEAAPTIIQSLHNSFKEASSTYGSINLSFFYQISESSSTKLASPLEGSPISNLMHGAKGRGEASKVKPPTVAL